MFGRVEEEESEEQYCFSQLFFPLPSLPFTTSILAFSQLHPSKPWVLWPRNIWGREAGVEGGQGELKKRSSVLIGY